MKCSAMADGTCTENRGRMDGAAFSGRVQRLPRVCGGSCRLPQMGENRGGPRPPGSGRQVRCAAPLPASRFRRPPPPEGRAFRAAGGLPHSPVLDRRLRQREQGGRKNPDRQDPAAGRPRPVCGPEPGPAGEEELPRRAEKRPGGGTSASRLHGMVILRDPAGDYSPVPD